MNKYWIMSVVLMCMASICQAETKWYMDEHRVGEGLVLSEMDDGRIIWGFYSHVEEYIIRPPIVSPKPPYKQEFCDFKTVWLTGLSTVVDDNGAYGQVFYDVAVPDFPSNIDNGDGIHKRISDQFVVGDFTLVRDGEGFVLYMESNNRMCNLSIFGVNHYMTHVVAQ